MRPIWGHGHDRSIGPGKAFEADDLFERIDHGWDRRGQVGKTAESPCIQSLKIVPVLNFQKVILAIQPLEHFFVKWTRFTVKKCGLDKVQG
jgi:hypothetical protein